jgi:hypothetical protein
VWGCWSFCWRGQKKAGLSMLQCGMELLHPRGSQLGPHACRRHSHVPTGTIFAFRSSWVMGVRDPGSIHSGTPAASSAHSARMYCVYHQYIQPGPQCLHTIVVSVCMLKQSIGVGMPACSPRLVDTARHVTVSLLQVSAPAGGVCTENSYVGPREHPWMPCLPRSPRPRRYGT